MNNASERHCPKCGYAQTRPGRFCSHCGEPLAEIKPRPERVPVRARERVFVSTTLMIFLGICIIIGGLYGSYKLYRLDQWGTLQTESTSTFEVVGHQDVPPPAALWSAVVLAGISTALGILLIASAHSITLIADLQDDITSMRSV